MTAEALLCGLVPPGVQAWCVGSCLKCTGVLTSMRCHRWGGGVGERYYQVDQGSIIQLRYNGEKNLLCWKSRIEFEPKTAETSTCLYSFNSPQQGSLTRSYEACYPARFLSCPSGCFYGGNWSGLVFSSACEMSSVAALF